eukprot:scaffold192017_cov55-Attheya_sp.AAC.1
MSPSAVANAAADPPGILAPSPSSPSSPQTDYLQMDQNEYNAETTRNVHPDSLFVELLEFVKKRNWKKKVLTVFIMVSSLCVFVDLIFFGHIQKILLLFLEWMTTHTTLAVFAFIAIFVVSTLIIVPPPFLIIGAGYAFAQTSNNKFEAILAALASCFIGSCIGAMIAFYRSRYMMRDLVKLFANRYPIIKAADRALQLNGFRIMLLLRLCPIVPFNGLNYIGGITKVSPKDFTFALVGTLPFQLLLVIIGATTKSLVEVDPNNTQELWLIIVVCAGIGFGIVAIVAAWKTCKKELQKNGDQRRGERPRNAQREERTLMRTMGSRIVWTNATLLLQTLANKEYLGRVMQARRWSRRPLRLIGSLQDALLSCLCDGGGGVALNAIGYRLVNTQLVRKETELSELDEESEQF